jgi:hypothetical protein
LESKTLRDVYDPEYDELSIIVARSRLPSSKAQAVRVVALLYAAGRQAAGYDDGWTSTEKIRVMARDFGIFDQSNFAATLARMGDVFALRGRGQQREVKVTFPGYEEARRLIGELAAVGSR